MILLDGPMGTELARRGVPTPPPGWSAYALESAPSIVRAIHDDYAMADLHRLNTFRAQPRIFPDHYRALVDTAITLVGERPFLGSTAPIEDCYRPDLSPAPDVARALHGAMADALRDAGCTRVICETFPHGGEAAIAVAACVARGLETWVSLTAGPHADLMTPAEMADAARACVDAGASAVLVACTSASHTRTYVKSLARVVLHTGSYANAGAPEEGIGWGDPRGPVRYAALARAWREEGATIIGACCGTGPAHVAALRDALR